MNSREFMHFPGGSPHLFCCQGDRSPDTKTSCERDEIMSTTKMATLAETGDAKRGWILSAASAHRAAERAANAAAVAGSWARRAGIAIEHAAEAARAAACARAAAERAAIAANLAEMQREATAAWTAAERALEADQRVSAAISMKLLAA